VHVLGWSDLIDVNSKGWSGLLSSRSEFAARALISLGSESLLCFRGTWDYILHPRADRVVMALTIEPAGLRMRVLVAGFGVFITNSPVGPSARGTIEWFGQPRSFGMRGDDLRTQSKGSSG